MKPQLGKTLRILLLSPAILSLGCGGDAKEETTPLKPTVTVKPDWSEDSDSTTDDSDGVQEEFYYTFVKERVFATGATNPTTAAEAANATALAIYDDYFYIPTGTWGPASGARKLVVDIWSISQGKKVGTITTPQPSEGSFCSAIHMLYVSGNRLFIGHGQMETFPVYYQAPVARIDIFDLTAPKTPTFITSIGGSIYNPFQDDTANTAKIAEPYAAIEKDGKLLVLDPYRLSVFDSSDLTSDKSGAITQSCFLHNQLTSRLAAAVFFVCDGEIYLSDPDKSNKGGLRHINWDGVIQADNSRLLDAGYARLEGVQVTKITAADDGYFVFSNPETGTMQRYDKAWQPVSECNSHFVNIVNGQYVASTEKITNAVPLPTPEDGMPRLLARNGSNVVIVRVERQYITEF